MPEATAAKLVDRDQQHWGVTSEILDLTAPSVAHDARFRCVVHEEISAWRRRASVARQRRCMRGDTWLDVRSVLSSIRVPTLILQRVGGRHHRVAFGRYLAEHIPGAKTSSCPASTRPLPCRRSSRLDPGRGRGVSLRRRDGPAGARSAAGDVGPDLRGRVDRGPERRPCVGRSLAVRSHDTIVREHLTSYRGLGGRPHRRRLPRHLRRHGRGSLVRGPARGRSRRARHSHPRRPPLRRTLARRPGCLLPAAHITACVMDAAEGGGVLVSQTVRDLVVGSGIELAHTVDGSARRGCRATGSSSRSSRRRELVAP